MLSVSNFGQFDPASSGPALKELYGLRNGKIQHIVGLDGAQDIAAVPLDVSQLYEAHRRVVGGQPARGRRCDRDQRAAAIRWSQYALLDATNRTDKPVTIKADGTVLRPSYDYQENLWILDRADTAPRLRVRDRDGKVTAVATDFGGDTPVQLRMAPDGVRALLLMRTRRPSRPMSRPATIQSTDTKQLKLGQFRKLQLPLAGHHRRAWNQHGILVAGHSTPASSGQPWQVNTDGSQLHLLPGASSAFDTDDRLDPERRHAPGGAGHQRAAALAAQGPQLAGRRPDQQGTDPITPVYPG